MPLYARNFIRNIKTLIQKCKGKLLCALLGPSTNVVQDCSLVYDYRQHVVYDYRQHGAA